MLSSGTGFLQCGQGKLSSSLAVVSLSSSQSPSGASKMGGMVSPQCGQGRSPRRAYSTRRWVYTSLSVPTVERGLWLPGWRYRLTVGGSPLIESTGGFASPQVSKPSASIYWRCPSLKRISKPSVDLPEPDTPLSTTSWFFGMLRLMFFRLCSRAPRMVMESDIKIP